jgi:hypothetical protein
VTRRKSFITLTAGCSPVPRHHENHGQHEAGHGKLYGSAGNHFLLMSMSDVIKICLCEGKRRNFSHATSPIYFVYVEEKSCFYRRRI